MILPSIVPGLKLHLSCRTKSIRPTRLLLLPAEHSSSTGDVITPFEVFFSLLVEEEGGVGAELADPVDNSLGRVRCSRYHITSTKALFGLH
jgi:hypothetical protein